MITYSYASVRLGYSCFFNTQHVCVCVLDSCLLQVLCVAVQLVETPRKILLSDTYTAWILTLFYSVTRDPRWLFTVPSKTSCQCRPLVSRLAFHLIGEACLAYPTGYILFRFGDIGHSWAKYQVVKPHYDHSQPCRYVLSI